MLYLLMGDIHLSDRPPSSCTDSYQDDLLDILREVGRLASQLGAAAIIWAGDVFHHKTASRTSHRTIRALTEIVKNYPCPVYVVPGNHDLANDRLGSLDETQPLGVLFAAGVVRRLDGWNLVRERILNALIYGVPWLGEFTHDSVDRALASWREVKPHLLGFHKLLVAHAPLYPPGQELKFEYYPTPDWADLMDNHGSAYYGHVHNPHGIYTVGGVTFINPGAVSRGSLHEHNLVRPVQIGCWDSETGQTRLLDVPHKPAEQILRIAEGQQKKTAKLNLDTFIASVGQTHLDITSVESVLDHVRGMDLTPDVRAVVTELLTEQTA